jgi:Prokaryotic N-terminal methylation motif
MRYPARATRQAFSLLEMVLALALGMVLLLALYFFLNTYILNVQSGRDVLAEGVLARNIMNRIGNDITSQLGPVDPRMLPNPNAVSEGTATPAGTSATATGGAPNTVYFNNGVYGTDKYLILSNFRVRKPPANQPTNVPDLEIISDVQRTVYWIVAGDTAGLARAEIKQATGADIDWTDPVNLPEQNKYVFAPEVKNIQFEYFDGTTWRPDAWDGSTLGDDGVTPIGPPHAIRITITLRAVTADDPNADGPKYQQVVAIPTTNAFAPKSATP